MGEEQPLSPSPPNSLRKFRCPERSPRFRDDVDLAAEETWAEERERGEPISFIKGERREIGVGVVATLDERGRSSLDGAAAAAADFIRPLSSTTRRNICLRLRLFAVPATLLPDLLPATRPAGLCYAVEHDTLCNALFSRKRGTRVIHPRPRAFDVTFTVFLTSGEEGKSL